MCGKLKENNINCDLLSLSQQLTLAATNGCWWATQQMQKSKFSANKFRKASLREATCWKTSIPPIYASFQLERFPYQFRISDSYHNFFLQYEWRKKIKPINTGIWIKKSILIFSIKKKKVWVSHSINRMVANHT